MQSNELSKKFIDIIPRAMQSIREELRNSARADFSVPQFRVLAYLGRNTVATNGDLAQHVGVTAPTMSRLVNSLVERKLVIRTTDKTDRREIKLSLSSKGLAKHSELRDSTKDRFARRFENLKIEDKKLLTHALKVMEGLFE
ncbi:MAG: MarR family transcriptional regulator [Bdellovibrionales bacterium]|nr:MarR family transcriptional regulator [Bdellovibrionales bacterium]